MSINLKSLVFPQQGPFWKNIGMKILVTSNGFWWPAVWNGVNRVASQVLSLGGFGFGVVDYRLFDVNFLLFEIIVFMFDAICFWLASSWSSCCLERTTTFDFILFCWVGGVKSFFVSIPAGVWEWRKMKAKQNPRLVASRDYGKRTQGSWTSPVRNM